MALLVWSAGDARARAPDEPQSVGERFSWLNRPDGLLIDGWEVRSFLLSSAGYDDNITLRRDDGPSSSELVLRGSIDAERGAGPYLLNLNGVLGRTWYPDSSENDATEANVRAGIDFDGKPLSVRGGAAYLQGVERTIDNGIYVDGIFQPYTTNAELRRIPVEAAFNYDISRFDLAGGLSITEVDYETQTTITGFSVPQDFRNGWEGEARIRGSYEVYPNLSLFAEAATTSHQYRDSNGDSDSWRVVAGSAVEFSRLLIGEASAGYTSLSLPNGGATSGFSCRARLHWFVSELVSLTLNAERSFDGEVVTTSTGFTSSVPVTRGAISLRGEWEPLRRLFVYAQAGYEDEKHETGGRTHELASINGGATYVLTSSVRLVIDGTYEFGTSDSSHDVERQRVAVGLAFAY